MRARPAALAVSALLLVGALSGCGGTEAATGTPTAAPPTSTPLPTPTPSPTPTVAPEDALEVIDTGAGFDCGEKVTPGQELGLWSSRLKARVPLRIDGVRSTGRGARVVGGLATTDRKPGFRPAGISDWPPTDMSQDFDWAARTNLAGLHLEAGQEIVPILHVVGGPGTEVTEAEILYHVGEVAAGAVIPLGLKLSGGTC